MTEKNRAEELECASVDETIYHAPYVVKGGCLYETVVVKEQTVHVKLTDFVPVLVSEITHDDGTEQKKLFRVRGVHRSGTVLPEALAHKKTGICDLRHRLLSLTRTNYGLAEIAI